MVAVIAAHVGWSSSQSLLHRLLHQVGVGDVGCIRTRFKGMDRYTLRRQLASRIAK